MGEGSIVGEEVLIDGSNYKYTVKVETVDCRLLVFERNANMKDFATKFLHMILRDEYLEKEDHRALQIALIINSHPERIMISQMSNSNPNDPIDEMRLKILGKMS